MKTQFNEFYQGQGFSRMKLECDGSGMADGWGNDKKIRPDGHGDGANIDFHPNFSGIDLTSPFYEE